MTFVIEIFKYLIPYWGINAALNIFHHYKLLFQDRHQIQIDYPFDFQKNFIDGRRILGKSTTWLGLVVSLISGLFFEYIFSQSWQLGIIKGLIAFFGHALGSFVKRRCGKKDGEFMIIADHGDYVILSALIFGIFQLKSLSFLLISIGVNLLIHPVLTYLGYRFGLREKKL